MLMLSSLSDKIQVMVDLFMLATFLHDVFCMQVTLLLRCCSVGWIEKMVNICAEWFQMVPRQALKWFWNPATPP